LRKKLTTVWSILVNTSSLSTFVKLLISFNAPAIKALNNPHNLLAKFRQLKLSSKSFLTSLSLPLVWQITASKTLAPLGVLKQYKHCNGGFALLKIQAFVWLI
jgi:hypothetical protein